MDEQEWLSSNDPARMLEFLQAVKLPPDFRNHASPRKLRLFACTLARQVWDGVVCGHCGGKGYVVMGYIRCDMEGIHDTRRRHECAGCLGTGRVGGLTDPRSRNAVEVAERYADGLATKEEVMKARAGAERVYYGDGGEEEASFELELACRLLGPVDEITENSGLPRWFSVSTKFAATQAALIRCIAGNPFRPVTLPKGPQCWMCDGEGKHYKMDGVFDCERCGGTGIDTCPWLTHNDGAVAKMARVIYDSRRWDELPILADALEESGCCAIPCPVCRGERTIVVHAGIGGVVSEWCGHCSRTGLVPNPILAHLRGPGPHARGCHVLDLLLGRE